MNTLITGAAKDLADYQRLTAEGKLGEAGQKLEQLKRKLDPQKARTMKIDRIPMDEATFRKMHAADRMASDKLEEGIEGFTKAIVALEKLIEAKL